MSKPKTTDAPLPLDNTGEWDFNADDLAWLDAEMEVEDLLVTTPAPPITMADNALRERLFTGAGAHSWSLSAENIYWYTLSNNHPSIASTEETAAIWNALTARLEAAQDTSMRILYGVNRIGVEGDANCLSRLAALYGVADFTAPFMLFTPEYTIRWALTNGNKEVLFTAKTPQQANNIHANFQHLHPCSLLEINNQPLVHFRISPAKLLTFAHNYGIHDFFPIFMPFLHENAKNWTQLHKGDGFAYKADSAQQVNALVQQLHNASLNSCLVQFLGNTPFSIHIENNFLHLKGPDSLPKLAEFLLYQKNDFPLPFMPVGPHGSALFTTHADKWCRFHMGSHIALQYPAGKNSEAIRKNLLKAKIKNLTIAVINHDLFLIGPEAKLEELTTKCYAPDFYKNFKGIDLLEPATSSSSLSGSSSSSLQPATGKRKANADTPTAKKSVKRAPVEAPNLDYHMTFFMGPNTHNWAPHPSGKGFLYRAKMAIEAKALVQLLPVTTEARALITPENEVTVPLSLKELQNLASRYDVKEFIPPFMVFTPKNMKRWCEFTYQGQPAFHYLSPSTIAAHTLAQNFSFAPIKMGATHELIIIGNYDYLKELAKTYNIHNFTLRLGHFLDLSEKTPTSPHSQVIEVSKENIMLPPNHGKSLS